MSVDFSQCLDCNNFISRSGSDFLCKAFPEGIPADLLWNRISHQENVPGDNGIKYEGIKNPLNPAIEQFLNSVRAIKILKREGYNTYNDIKDINLDTLRSMKGMGEVSAQQIIADIEMFEKKVFTWKNRTWSD